MSEKPIPAWKQFYHPLSIWKVLGVFVAMNLVITFIFVAMREGLGLGVPQWPVGGIAGILSVLLVHRMALAARKAESEEPPAA